MVTTLKQFATQHKQNLEDILPKAPPFDLVEISI